MYTTIRLIQLTIILGCDNKEGRKKKEEEEEE